MYFFPFTLFSFSPALPPSSSSRRGRNQFSSERQRQKASSFFFFPRVESKLDMGNKKRRRVLFHFHFLAAEGKRKLSKIGGRRDRCSELEEEEEKEEECSIKL